MNNAQDRNINVGKSWTRDATPCTLIPKWEGEFISYDDWVNFASKRLTVTSSNVTGALVPAFCVDTLGRRMTCGGDFARARDEKTFPVRYAFECEEKSNIDSYHLINAIPSQPDPQVTALLEALQTIADSGIGIAHRTAQTALTVWEQSNG